MTDCCADNDCGEVMSACFGTAPRWADYGVPAPSISNFSYEVDAGLLRTPVDTGYARQRRRYTHRPTTYELTWLVTTSDLHAVENLIQERGYDWLYVPMVTGQVPKWMAVDHLIRMTSNLQVSLVEKDLWEANITAEQYEIDPSCLFDQVCDELRGCLPTVSFRPITQPYPPLTNWPIDDSQMIADFGTWSNVNG